MGQRPTVKKIKASNFIKFYNEKKKEIFYDFGESLGAHQRSIQFYLLAYLKGEDAKYELRHGAFSVKKFDPKKQSLEKTLSKQVEKYINAHPEFKNDLLEKTQ